jgi:RNA polymerase sigma-70 factor, ECF subfamily
MPEGESEAERRSEFERIALPHLDRLHGTALHLVRDPDRAADLVQETMLRAFRFFDHFERGTNCLAWLQTILHNAFRNRYRSEKRERTHTDVDDPANAAEVVAASGDPADPESLVLSQMFDGDVRAALEALAEEFRSVILLVDVQDLTYEEAARALDCPIGTIRSRLSRGRSALARRLATRAPAPPARGSS